MNVFLSFKKSYLWLCFLFPFHVEASGFITFKYRTPIIYRLANLPLTSEQGIDLSDKPASLMEEVECVTLFCEEDLPLGEMEDDFPYYEKKYLMLINLDYYDFNPFW